MKTRLRSPALEGPLANLPRPIYGERSRRRVAARIIAAVGVLVFALGLTAIWRDAFGVGERFDHLLDRIALIINPPPDRPTAPTVAVPVQRSDPPEDASEPPETDEPSGSPALLESSPPSTPPSASTRPSPTPPVRRHVNVSLVSNAKKYFASEFNEEMCAAAAVQSVIAFHGKADTSDAFQRRLQSRIREWDSWRDSHNGGWGPSAMVNALNAYGVPGYEVRAYGSRADALFDAAKALTTYRRPVILLAWRGAHAWVMIGYKATLDPRYFQEAYVNGTYIIDPWYPRVSSIWGPSDPPGAYQDWKEMRRNYRPWQRPEGLYPERDGKFIAVVPTTPKSGG